MAGAGCVWTGSGGSQLVFVLATCPVAPARSVVLMLAIGTEYEVFGREPVEAETVPAAAEGMDECVGKTVADDDWLGTGRLPLRGVEDPSEAFWP